MKVMFVSAFTSNSQSAYNQRLINLKEGLQQCGIATKMLYLGDYFIRSPTLIQILDIPMILRELEDYDVIHGGTSAACYVLGLTKNLHNFTLIHDVHGCLEEYLLKRGKFDFLANFSYLQGLILEGVSNRQADFFITCSKPLRDRLLQRGINRNRIEVIHNAVDLELFKPKNFPCKGKEFVVTYAGALQKWQGIENFVAAAKLIEETEVKFRIIGFKKENWPFKRELSRVLGNKAELIDSLSQAELVNQLSSSDILIIPRSSHCATQMAFPTKFAEYIATGKPIIVTDVDETANFVRDYDCGFVCQPSAESIARTIIKAWKLPTNTLLSMGKNGRRLAELYFDRRIIARKYFDFLHAVLAKS